MYLQQELARGLRPEQVELHSMSQQQKQSQGKSWTKPELTRLGQLADVANAQGAGAQGAGAKT
jgi:hypothetical protein